jgi:Xylose isomerase-like TIM barrel
MDRREWFSRTGALGAVTALSGLGTAALAPAAAAAATEAPPPHGTWSMFSRHLQYVSTQAQAAADPFGTGVKVGQQAALMGAGAVNLTVRSGGHVEPTLVATNLGPMLAGIRSTGIICEYITTGINPSTDPADTSWIQSQLLYNIFSVAAANGIKKYRFGAAGAYPATPTTFGPAITAFLDGYRVNVQRLLAWNRKFGLQGLYHTFNNQVGIALWDLLRVWDGMDPNLIGFNYAIGHVVQDSPTNGANSMWASNLRYAMPYVRGMALQDNQWVKNADGTFTSSTPLTGTGQVNWNLYFQLLLQGGYNGMFDLQEEYSIVGNNGTSVTLNNTFWSDNVQFTSGNLTPALMVATLKTDFDFYKTKALAAGWSAGQLTP